MTTPTTDHYHWKDIEALLTGRSLYQKLWNDKGVILACSCHLADFPLLVQSYIITTPPLPSPPKTPDPYWRGFNWCSFTFSDNRRSIHTRWWDQRYTILGQTRIERVKSLKDHFSYDTSLHNEIFVQDEIWQILNLYSIIKLCHNFELYHMRIFVNTPFIHEYH